MANVQTAFGLRHIGYTSGAGPDYQMAKGTIVSTNTTKIFFGDPVVLDPTTGFLAQAANNTTTLSGIFAGCQFTPSGGLGIPQWSPFWPGAAASNAIGYIINAPNALFLAATLNTAIVTANIGENVGFAIGTGSQIGAGLSGATLDQSTLLTTNTLPFRIVGLYQGIGNGSDPATPFNWVEVTFNNQNFKQLTGIA